MKIKAFICFLLLSSGIVSAEYRVWTNSEGDSVKLKLVSVADEDGEKVGTFRKVNGLTYKVKASELSEEDAKVLNEWEPPAEEVQLESVFDDILDGNLVKVDGKEVVRCDDATKPAKYYIFYYTASWCGPCQKFTPSLVKWYEKNKNDNFELVLITSDSCKIKMGDYAVSKKMPWPMLKQSKANDFKKKFKHGVRGIPSVIVCDLKGENLGEFRSNLDGITKLVKE